jgi:hypothetical protein
VSLFGELYGAIEGRLESIQEGYGTLQFYIRDALLRQRVRCYFPEELLADVFDGTAGKDAEVAEACWQAIDPYTNKPETMTFNYCCFAIAPTTASWSRIQGGL